MDSSSSSDPSLSEPSADSMNNDPVKSRRGQEYELVRDFVHTVLQTGRALMEVRQLGEDDGKSKTKKRPDVMTSLEKRVFRKQSYYGWMQGFLTGGSFFAVTFGGLRWAAARHMRYKLPTKSGRDYSSLDGRKKRSKTILQTPSGNDTSERLALSDDVMVQLQFICCGAMALVLTTVTAQVMADQPRFYRELAKVPLQPGTSLLCRDMCPALIQQRDNMMLSKEDPLSNTTANDLWKDPTTEELESIVHLVQNCEQRLDYERYLRRKQGLEQDAEVEIPAGGVPQRYVSVSSYGDDGDSRGDFPNDEISREWARSMAMDQEEEQR